MPSGSGGETSSFGPALPASLLFASSSAMWVLAFVRVRRGEIDANRQGFVIPFVVEFALMGFGLRLPRAVAGLRGRG
jgi:hypothetical protein